MEVALRKRVQGGWWAGISGLGTEYYPDGEPIETYGLPTDSTPDYNYQTYGSGEVDLSTLPSPGYNIPTTPAAPLTQAELAAEQQRAYNWLQNLPADINLATKVILSATQITQGLQSGAVKASSTCPSGYMVEGGRCVEPSSQGQLVPGLSNNTLLLIGGGVLLFALVGGGGRRR